MCLLESCGMSAVCTWGLRGGAFFRRFFFWSPSLRLRVSFSAMCANSNTPFFSRNDRFFVRTCCHISATSPHTICHYHLFSFQPNSWPLRSIRTLHMTSYLRSIAAKNIHRHLRIHTSFMAKTPPPQSLRCTLLWQTVTWISPHWLLTPLLLMWMHWPSPPLHRPPPTLLLLNQRHLV